MLVELARKHEVTYLAFFDEGTQITEEEENSPYAAFKRWIPLREHPKPSLALLVAVLKNFLFSTLPWALAKWHHPAMVRAIEEECRNTKYDLLVCDFLYPALNVASASLSLPAVLFQHNIESLIWKRMAENKTSLLSRAYFMSQHDRFFRAEKALSAGFDAIITVSPEDTRFARERYGLDNVLGDVPTGVDTGYFTRQDVPPKPKRLGFLGSMDWMPNIEGVAWFVKEILPSLRRTDPEIEFVVIGRNPPSSIRDLAASDPKIVVTGTVDDVRTFVSECRAIVVPLLSGGGTRLKILEALAMGVPVISTSIGAEGLMLEHDRHILLADLPDEFAASCVRLLESDETCTALSRNGRELVTGEHGWARAALTFQKLCGELLASRFPTDPSA
jgi:glycosyltransferase involved in cell wall biosynthesis